MKRRRSSTAGIVLSALAITSGSLLIAGHACLAAPATLHLTSSDLLPGKPVSERYVANAFGCHGQNESPELSWTGAPPGTRSFAVTMFDPYRPPVSGWWHWIVFDLPATTTELPHGAGSAGSSKLPAGAKQGLPDGEAPEAHYYGPCPDVGDPPHRYVITVYALSVEHLDAPRTATAAHIAYLIAGKTLAQASIVRPYRR